MKAAFVLVKCELGRLEQVANALMELEGVSEVHSITGAYDLIVKLYASSYEDFGDVIPDRLQKVPGIKGHDDAPRLPRVQAHRLADEARGGPMAFRIRQPVRHPDVDRAGIVYFPRFYDFFHRALEDFFRDEVGIPYHSVEEALRVAMPVVRIETDFERPLAHGDIVTIELETEAIGTSSVTLRYKVFRPGQAEPAAIARTVICCIEVPGWKKIPVPANVRAAFERHLAPR